ARVAAAPGAPAFFDTLAFGGAAAISPTGDRLVFATKRSDENYGRLWLQSLTDPSSKPLDDTQAARLPFWSPEGRQVGYFAKGKLRQKSIEGGDSQPLCDASPGMGCTWNARGEILFSSNTSSGLLLTNGHGGNCRP